MKWGIVAAVVVLLVTSVIGTVTSKGVKEGLTQLGPGKTCRDLKTNDNHICDKAQDAFGSPCTWDNGSCKINDWGAEYNILSSHGNPFSIDGLCKSLNGLDNKTICNKSVDQFDRLCQMTPEGNCVHFGGTNPTTILCPIIREKSSCSGADSNGDPCIWNPYTNNNKGGCTAKGRYNRYAQTCQQFSSPGTCNKNTDILGNLCQWNTSHCNAYDSSGNCTKLLPPACTSVRR